METNNLIAKAYEKYKSDGLTRVTSRNIEKIIGHKLDDSEKRQLKRAKQEDEERNQPVVSSVEIEVNWSNNPTWGWNPTAVAHVRYEDDSYDRFSERASGCGYNKLNHVVNNLLNHFLKRPLHE